MLWVGCSKGATEGRIVESCFHFLIPPLQQALDAAMSRTEEHHFGFVPRDWPSSGWVWQPHTGDGSMWQGVILEKSTLVWGAKSFYLWFEFEYLIWTSCESLLSCHLERNPQRHNIQSQFSIDIVFFGRTGAESPAHRKLHYQGTETENRILAGSSCNGKTGKCNTLFQRAKRGWAAVQVVQLIDTIGVRHGLMLVGPTGGCEIWELILFEFGKMRVFVILRFYVVLFFNKGWLKLILVDFGISQESKQHPFWQGGKTCNYRLLQATSIAMCEARKRSFSGMHRVGNIISSSGGNSLIPSQIRCHLSGLFVRCMWHVPLGAVQVFLYCWEAGDKKYQKVQTHILNPKAITQARTWLYKHV